MSRVLRPVRKRKKGHTLGAVDVIDREEYAELEVDAKVELIRSMVPLGLRHIEELLDEEVTALLASATPAKPRQSAGAVMAATPGRSGWPASACRFRVPRIRWHVTERESPAKPYEALLAIAQSTTNAEARADGISWQRLGGFAEAIPSTIGLSGVDGEGVHSGQRDETPRAPGAGPLRFRRRGPRAGRQDVRRGAMVVAWASR